MDANGGSQGGHGSNRRKFTTWDVVRLVLRTYWVSLPYLLIVVLGLLVATWLVTTVIW